MKTHTDIFKKIESLDDEGVWDTYAFAIDLLKRRQLVRTKNITGERGEFLALEAYNNTPGFPNLQAAPAGTQNVDALSRKGDRYSIKTITEPNNLTSVFYGLGDPGSNKLPEKKFEYIIIVIIGESLHPVMILELSWDQFIKFRKWHKTMRGWNISIAKKLIDEAKIIFHKKI